jgi:hypothetical protein
LSDSQTSLRSPERLAQAIYSGSAPELLATLFPSLKTYLPPQVLTGISKPQALFLLANSEELLYGGAVGGGKTAALLMAALQYVHVPGYAALILRRTFPEITQPDGLLPQSMRWFGQVPEAQRPVYTAQEHEWKFPSGAVIRFGHLDHPNSMIRYQGGGYHLVGFDELTHFEQDAYEFIALSRQRKPPTGPLSQVPIRIRGTANPGGPGHTWVKKRFIDNAAEEPAFIPSKVWDNPGIDPEDYVQRLLKLPDVRRQQLLDGDWGAFEGAAFEQFDRKLHCIPAIQLPPTFARFESMDYGIRITSWLAWAVDYESNLITFGSHYKGGIPSETAPMILKKRQFWKTTECWGDPQSLATRTTRQNKFGDPYTIETEFADLGIEIARANNEPRVGYTRLRELLRPDPKHRFPDWHVRAGQYGSPRWFIVEGECPELCEQLETAPLVPADKRWAGEMIDPEWESAHGHAVASARYGATTRPAASVEPELPPSNPEWSDDQTARAEFFWELNKRRENRSNEPTDYELV